jgi:hypothetical protein
MLHGASDMMAGCCEHDNEPSDSIKDKRFFCLDEVLLASQRTLLHGVCKLDASDSGQGPVTDSCEHGNELSGCIKGGEFRN